MSLGNTSTSAAKTSGCWSWRGYRSLLVQLATIPEGQHRPERDLWEKFNEARPRILGALRTAVSCALRRLPKIKLDKCPRMADAATWVEAATPALGWKSGEFITVYDTNRKDTSAVALEDNLVVPAIRKLLSESGRRQAVDPHQPLLLPDSPPAPSDPHSQVLPSTRKPDSIIRTMNQRAEPGQEGERLGYIQMPFLRGRCFQRPGAALAFFPQTISAKPVTATCGNCDCFNWLLVWKLLITLMFRLLQKLDVI